MKISTAPVAPTTSSPAAPTSTDVLIYSPVNLGDSLQPGLSVSGSYAGTCQGSIAVVRSDGLRCSLSSGSLPNGSNLLDPCFAAGPTTAYCTDDPTSKSVVKIQETAPEQFPDVDPATPTANAPWAIQLADGTVCTSLTGATGTIDGQRENYGCSTGNLYGDPDRTAALWTIFFAGNGATTQSSVPIAKAWF